MSASEQADLTQPALDAARRAIVHDDHYHHGMDAYLAAAATAALEAALGTLPEITRPAGVSLLDAALGAARHYYRVNHRRYLRKDSIDVLRAGVEQAAVIGALAVIDELLKDRDPATLEARLLEMAGINPDDVLS